MMKVPQSILVTLLIGLGGLHGQTVTQIGQWTEGVTNGVAVAGNAAFYSNGTWLESIDISDLENPAALGRIDMVEGIRQLIADSTTLYVRQGRRLVVVDIGDPANPAPVDTVAWAYEAMTLSGDRLIGGRSQRIHLIDVADRQLPGEPKEIEVPIRPDQMAAAGDLLFVLTQEAEVYIYTLADPENPVLLSTISRTRGQGIAVHEDRLYFSSDSLVVFDVSDPASPIQVSAQAGYRHNFAFQDGLMFTYDLNGRIHSYDLTDPDHPLEIGDYWPEISGNTSFGAAGAAVFGEGHVVMADAEFGTLIIDTSDPTDMQTIAAIRAGGRHSYAELVGDQMLISSSAAGMTVLNVSDPTKPIVHQRITDLNTPVETAVYGDYAYVAGRPSAILHRDGDTWIKVMDFAFFASDVDVDGDRVYFLSKEVRVFDLTDPSFPSQIGTFGDFNSPRSFLVRNDTVFVDESSDGIFVFDATDVESATQIAHIELPGYGWEMIADSGRLIAARHTADVQFVNVDDLSNPEIVAIPSTYGYRDFVRSQGKLLGLNSWGIYLFDESAAAIETTYLAVVQGGPARLLANDDILYALATAEGLRIFRVDGVETALDDLPAGVATELVDVYPNPFVSSVNIRVHIKSDTDYSVNVFDITGRRIKQFMTGGVNNLPRALTWDGSVDGGADAAPGLYIIVVRSGEERHIRTVHKLR